MAGGFLWKLNAKLHPTPPPCNFRPNESVTAGTVLNPQAGRPVPVGQGKRARSGAPTDVMQPAKALSTEETCPPLCPLTSSRALPTDNADTQNYPVVFDPFEDHDFPKAHRRRRASNVHKDRTVLFPAPRHSSSLKNNDSFKNPTAALRAASGAPEIQQLLWSGGWRVQQP
jgi:hypothetical protein